jgi:hypothetical protein
MTGEAISVRLVAQEARALLTRLWRIKPYALNTPAVPAATVSPQAQAAIEKHMLGGRQRLDGMVRKFIAWVDSPDGKSAAPDELQRAFSMLRLRFNSILTQFDIFGDVLVQRSEHGTGVWIAGLDVAAADALTPAGRYAELPPIICYLDRGAGAAIRRARTRLPGGDENPVGIIRVPRERMVGSGVASSLVHEVGHQAAALTDLVPSLRRALIQRTHEEEEEAAAWRFWDLWISEIVADLWAVGLLGITATMGLLAVVSLPRPFVFRIAQDDPHPFPWFRVKLSCEMGNALYPHPQWAQLSQAWEELYPRAGLDGRRLAIIGQLERTTAEFVAMLLEHRPEMLHGARIRDFFPLAERTPEQLGRRFDECRRNRARLQQMRPSLAFAALGQARAEDKITPEREGELLVSLLTHWAVRSSLDTSVLCASTSTWNANSSRQLERAQWAPQPVSGE